MSEISDAASVSIILADFANMDSSGGKLNIVGAGITITGIEPQTGQTLPITLVASVGIPPRFVGSQYSLEVAIYDAETGDVVVPPGTAQPIRVAQPVQVEPVQAAAGTYIPPDTVRAGTNLIMAFPNGLPLSAGRFYYWRVKIDTNLVAESGLLVAGPPPIVVG